MLRLQEMYTFLGAQKAVIVLQFMLILRVAMFWFEVKALAVSSKYYASSDKGCNGCDRKTIAIKAIMRNTSF